MHIKFLVTTTLVAALVVVPVTRAAADAKGVAAAALLIGIIASQSGKKSQRRTTRPGISQAQREQNRQVQTALNYFDYPVGTVDGALGARSRTAMQNYEAAMGFNVDGSLDDFERDFLLTSYQKAQTSAQFPPYSQILAREGTQGLLRTYRNEQRGIPTPGSNIVPAVQPEPQAPAVQPGLPSFGGVDPGEQRSINAHCNQITVLTTTNGGFTTQATMADPRFALNEQFCLARTNAVSQADSIVSSIPNMTNAQFLQQCEALGAYMAPHISALGEKTPADVQRDVATVLQSSGQSSEDLRVAGRICLGVGYREDRADIALASALVMVGTDEAAYGELIGHHMREGFGTPASRAQSEAWLTTSLASLEGGAAPVFLPNQSAERIALMRMAMAAEPASTGGGALPTFTVPSGN